MLKLLAIICIHIKLITHSNMYYCKHNIGFMYQKKVKSSFNIRDSIHQNILWIDPSLWFLITIVVTCSFSFIYIISMLANQQFIIFWLGLVSSWPWGTNICELFCYKLQKTDCIRPYKNTVSACCMPLKINKCLSSNRSLLCSDN